MACENIKQEVNGGLFCQLSEFSVVQEYWNKDTGPIKVIVSDSVISFAALEKRHKILEDHQENSNMRKGRHCLLKGAVLILIFLFNWFVQWFIYKRVP